MSNTSPILLGVNIDHIATLRQARGTRYPDPVKAAMDAEFAGAVGAETLGMCSLAMCVADNLSFSIRLPWSHSFSLTSSPIILAYWAENCLSALFHAWTQ